MRYLIVWKGSPFYTKWFNVENFEEGMTVFDLKEDLYSTDGINWLPIKTDTL